MIVDPYETLPLFTDFVVAQEESLQSPMSSNAEVIDGEASPTPSLVEDRRSGQLSFVADGDWRDEEWAGMPEFVQEDLAPYRTLYVHFESQDAVLAFAALIGQRIGPRIRFIWYPKAEIGHFADKRYVDTAQACGPSTNGLAAGSAS